MDGSWLNQFQGQHVTVLTNTYNEERNDTGTMLKIGEGWVQLVKDTGDMILIPSTAIRMIKLLALTQTVNAVEREPEARISSRIYEPNAQTM